MKLKRPGVFLLFTDSGDDVLCLFFVFQVGLDGEYQHQIKLRAVGGLDEETDENWSFAYSDYSVGRTDGPG